MKTAPTPHALTQAAQTSCQPQRSRFSARAAFSALASVAAGAALSASLFAAAPSFAQSFPSKPITLVVTYPAGGGADLMARTIAPKMAAILKQPVVVENRPGASGQIGAAFVAGAPADGHTLMFDASSFAVNPSLYAKMNYDTEKAFTVVGVTALFPNVLVANPNYSAKSVGDVLAAARAKPGAVAFASSGNGSAQHLAGALFELQAKVDMLHIPYKGGGPAMIDVMGGQVPLAFSNLASSLAHIKAGKLKPLGVTSSKRSGILPDVPTLAEAGVREYEVHEWNVLAAPSGVPAPVVAQLAAALKAALESAEVKERVAVLGGVMFTGSQADSSKFVRDQMVFWGRVVKSKGIKPE